MGKLIVTEFVTLDGVAQAPGGPDEDRESGFTRGGCQAPLVDQEADAIAPVTPADLAYAWEQMRDLSRLSSRAVQWGRTRLGAAGVRSSATADAILTLDDDLVMCAGAVAPTTREAIDELAGRLRHRIVALRERGDRCFDPSLRRHDAHGTDQTQPRVPSDDTCVSHDRPTRSVDCTTPWVSSPRAPDARSYTKGVIG